MNKKLRVLVIEDNATDAELNIRELRRAGYEPEWKLVQTEADYLAALDNPPDLILSDYTMPNFNGLQALALLKKRGLDIPFILISGTLGEESAVAAMKEGATDYLLKDRLARLAGAVERALSERCLRDERNRALAELRESEALYHSLVENLPQNIFRKDREGRFTFANQRFCRTLGRTLEEVLGKADEDFFPPELAAKYRADDRRLMETGQMFDAEEQFREGKGRTRHVQVIKSVLRNGTNQPIGIQGVFTDVTEKKELEAQFLRSQRMESIGALSGGIAHDLNNALAPILIASEFLRMSTKDPENARILSTIHECAQRGAGMVKQILVFARGTGADTGVVHAKQLLGGMIDIARQTFPKSIQIRTDVGRDIWTIPGNATQLHQVMLNLCVNARDAMSNGGTLTLAAANARLDDSQTGIAPDAKPGTYVVLSIRDTGTGMTPEVCARIFEPFFTTKELEKGTGLGLSTARGILKGHHGFITVESKPGRGTEFKVYLPAVETPVEAAPKEAPPELPMGAGELILLVDDEAAIRKMNKHILEMFGYTVLAASDGAQAVAICAQHLADLKLVITDMAMPVMDGPAAICAIRSLAPAMKFLVTSGMESETRVLDRLSLEAQAFIPKPYSAEELLRTVHRVLHEKGGEERQTSM